jgi:hypothetical protein
MSEPRGGVSTFSVATRLPPDAMTRQTGARVLLFLVNQPGGELGVVGGFQGAYEISGAAASEGARSPFDRYPRRSPQLTIEAVEDGGAGCSASSAGLRRGATPRVRRDFASRDSSRRGRVLRPGKVITVFRFARSLLVATASCVRNSLIRLTSAEHGDALDVMKRIKNVMDQKGLLNPGKLYGS